MRFNEIKKSIKEDQDLFEINMSPTNLKKLAAQTGALAGMEFEMIVPGIEGGDDNGEQEPDYDYDERVTSIEDAAQFFDDGDYNGRREIQRLREQMSDSYQEWLGEAWMEHFETYKTTIVFRYGKENWSEADIAEIMGLDEAETEALETRSATPEDYMDAAEKVIEDGLDPWLNDAQEDAQEEYYDEDHEDDWLRSQGLNYMSDIENQYEIMWPYWGGGAGDEGAGIESVADEFREAIGRKVNWSASYHGGKREANTYVVEPDGSLIPDDSDDAGLEFVSPPLPIDDMISDLNKVKAWADQRGCYTSKAAKTGLHINVSVPGFDNDKLDYVKLTLLLGDEYVLNQFGRLGNSYANSAMGIIKERIAQRPEDAAAMLQKMKTGLGELATKVIHSGTTSKFTSINTKTGYIEFRSPGGDWLDSNFDQIETTLMRFVVALDAAMDPAKYLQEYQQKLYKLLTGQQSGRTKSNLEWDISSKAMIWTKDQRFARGKDAFTARQTPAFSTTVTAKTAKEAWEKAKPSPDANASEYKIEPRSAAGPDNDALLKIFSKWSTGEMSEAELSKGLKQAQLERSKVKDTYAELKTGQSNYKIYQISDGPYDGRIVGTFYAADQAQADSEFTDWLMSPAAGGRDDFRYAPIDSPIQRPAANTTRPRPDIIDIEPDVEQNFVPGSTQDIQQRRAAGGEFTGAWRVLDPEDREIYRFSGVGNNQSDANRVAMNWLRQNPGRMQPGVTVVPIMS
jgi:hypothetical protein